MEFYVDNVWTRVSPENSVENQFLFNVMSVKDPQSFFNPSFQRGDWDGFYRFYNPHKFIMQTGLLPIAVKECENNGVKFRIFDNRKNIGAVIDALRDDPVDEGYEIREERYAFDYQADAFNSVAFNTIYGIPFPRGIVNIATNGGKTSVAIMLIKHMLPVSSPETPFMFMVHSKEIATQAAADISAAIGEDVGFLMAGKQYKGERVIVGTNAFLYSRIKRDDKRVTEILKNAIGFVADECLTGETLVTLADGGVRKISKIQNGDVLPTGTVSNAFSRKSEIFKVKSSCAILRGSPEHLTVAIKRKPRGQKYSDDDFQLRKLKDLNSDWMIPVSVSVPHTVKNSVTPAEAAFAAMVMCDGHLDKTGDSGLTGKHTTKNRVKVQFKKDEDMYRTTFSKYAMETGIPYRESVNCRGDTTLWFSSPEIRKTMEVKWGIPEGKKSADIEIPEFLYYSPLETIKAFIETCFNCEGDLTRSSSVSDSGKPVNNPRLNFNSCSRSFCYGLQALLRKFGIISSVQWIDKTKHRVLHPNHHDVYRVHISGNFLKLFYETFTLIPRKTTDNFSTIDCKNKIVNGYYLSRVYSAEYEGTVEDVYDFTVSNTHLFEANGVITHNCHHYSADTFQDTVKLMTGAVARVGLTGTVPKDKLKAYKCYQVMGDIVARVRNAKLIERGISAKPSVLFYRIDERMYFDRDNADGLTIYQAALDDLVINCEERNRIIARICNKEVRAGRHVLVLVERIEHGANILKAILKYNQDFSLTGEDGFSVFFTNGQETLFNREKSLEELKLGNLDVLISTAILDEGVDVSGIDAVVYAKSGVSRRKLLQGLGRGIRKKADNRCLHIYDFLDMGERHLMKHSQSRFKTYRGEGFFIKLIDENDVESTPFSALEPPDGWYKDSAGK